MTDHTLRSATARQSASDVLNEFLDTCTTDKVAISDLVQGLGRRSFGITLMVFALANILIANIPGISTILGLPIVVISLQLLANRPRPWLPKRFFRMEIERTRLENMIRRAQKVLAKAERLIKPRLATLTEPAAERVLGFFCVIQGCVLILPILFGNWLPSWSVLLIALGLIEKDGVCVLLGLAFGLASITYATLFFDTVLLALIHFGQWLAAF